MPGGMRAENMHLLAFWGYWKHGVGWHTRQNITNARENRERERNGCHNHLEWGVDLPLILSGHGHARKRAVSVDAYPSPDISHFHVKRHAGYSMARLVDKALSFQAQNRLLCLDHCKTINIHESIIELPNWTWPPHPSQSISSEQINVMTCSLWTIP